MVTSCELLNFPDIEWVGGGSLLYSKLGFEEWMLLPLKLWSTGLNTSVIVHCRLSNLPGIEWVG